MTEQEFEELRPGDRIRYTDGKVERVALVVERHPRRGWQSIALAVVDCTCSVRFGLFSSVEELEIAGINGEVIK